MNINGISSDTNSKTHSFFFPTKCYQIEKGDSFKEVMRIKRGLDGLEMSADGYNTITFETVRTIDNIKCAVFRGVINVYNLKLAEGLTDKNKCSEYGIAFYYFDLEDHHFLGCTFNTVIEIHTHLEVHKEKLLDITEERIAKTTTRIWFDY